MTDAPTTGPARTLRTPSRLPRHRPPDPPRARLPSVAAVGGADHGVPNHQPEHERGGTMTRRRFAVLLVSAVGAMRVRSASAHHGWSGYDADTPMTLSGIIRE